MRLYEMNMVQYGVFDSRIKFPRIFRTQWRTVECYEIELFTEDQSGVCYIDDATIPLKKGTLICAKPGQKRSSKLHFRCINMHLQVTDPILKEALDQLPNSSVLSEFEELTELIHKILGLDLHSFPEQKFLLHSYVYQFLFQLIAELRTGQCAGGDLCSHRQVVRQVERFIREHPEEDLGLQALASMANLSPVYFHRLFRAHTGMTPAAYVLGCRIAAAKAQLKAGDMSISEIATRCGFNSQSYFNFKFKEITGETPLQYRKARLSRLEL